MTEFTKKPTPLIDRLRRVDELAFLYWETRTQTGNLWARRQCRGPFCRKLRLLLAELNERHRGWKRPRPTSAMSE